MTTTRVPPIIPQPGGGPRWRPEYRLTLFGGGHTRPGNAVGAVISTRVLRRQVLHAVPIRRISRDFSTAAAQWRRRSHTSPPRRRTVRWSHVPRARREDPVRTTSLIVAEPIGRRRGHAPRPRARRDHRLGVRSGCRDRARVVARPPGAPTTIAMERTAESIAEGELDERVPGANEKTEVGRLAGHPERHARPDPASVRRERRHRSRSPRIERSGCGGSSLTPPTSFGPRLQPSRHTRSSSSAAPRAARRTSKGSAGDKGRDSDVWADSSRTSSYSPASTREYRSPRTGGAGLGRRRCRQDRRSRRTAWPVTLVAANPVEVTGDGLASPAGDRQLPRQRPSAHPAGHYHHCHGQHRRRSGGDRGRRQRTRD